MNINAFKVEIKAKLRNCPDSRDLYSAVDHFDKIVCSVLDSNAPIQRRNDKRKPMQPWYDDEIHIAKRQRRWVIVNSPQKKQLAKKPTGQTRTRQKANSPNGQLAIKCWSTRQMLLYSLS